MSPLLLKTACITVVLFCSANLYAQGIKHKDQEDTVQKGLDLKIEITSNNLCLGGATVKIYQDNKFIAVLNNKIQSNMNVRLERNTYYVMEVDKPGYISKSILISTALPEGSDNTKYEHDISISLDKKPALKNNNAATLIGILYYDPKKDVYVGCQMADDTPEKEEIIAQLDKWLD